MDILRTAGESALIAALVIGLGSLKLHLLRAAEQRRSRRPSAPPLRHIRH